jgi:hypothetical protein
LVAAEFIIDGRPLLEHCERAAGRTFDLVSAFGWTLLEHQRALAERMLLRRSPLLPSGRQELLVCPECADLGCGCISAVIHAEDKYFFWSDFGSENNYDPGSLSLFPMGKFIFLKEDVIGLLASLVPGLNGTTG